MRAAAVVLVLAVVVVLAGCGGGGSSSDAVRSAWKSAAAAAAAGDGAKFCDLVTPAGQRAITSATRLPCADSVRLLGARLTDADKRAIADAKITKIDVHGDDATVTYVTTPSLSTVGFTGRTTLRRSNGRWLLLGVS